MKLRIWKYQLSVNRIYTMEETLKRLTIMVEQAAKKRQKAIDDGWKV